MSAILGSLQIPAAAAAGKVLTSDAAGFGTWQTPAASTPRAFAFFNG